MQTRVATTLEDVYKTLSPKPLITPELLSAYYQESLNRARGGTKTERMARGLLRTHGATFYKAVLGGHSGVGKTTELAYLTEREEVAGKFQPLWFSALSDIDPGGFRPFDVVLVMMMKLVEETAKPVQEGGAGKRPSDSLLQAVQNWFATETSKFTEGTTVGASMEAGVGVKGDSLWAAVMGLFFNARGEAKYTSDRNKEVVEYRLQRIFSLIDLANRLLDECNGLLKTATGKEWLFIGDDFEKSGITLERTEDLFVNYANIFNDLRAHLIFTIPVALLYSNRATGLPFERGHRHSIPDTPVFTPDHQEHIQGRQALRTVVFARVAPELFAPGQLDRLLAASGGNLRDLFSLIVQAADEALDRDEAENGTIQATDVETAINRLRLDYTRALGESPDDRAANITYENKVERLKRIYDGDKKAEVADAVLHSLLRARAVQEFNGEGWFGVHPLVVSILQRQGGIEANAEGVVPGAA